MTVNKQRVKIYNNGTDESIKAEWNRSPEIRAEFGDNFESFAAFCRHAGNVKILG